MNVSSINSAADARRLFAVELNADKAGSAPSAASAASAQLQKQASAAAKQFEAIILRQLLAPAIDPMMSSEALGGKGMGGGGGGVYGYLVTDVLANSLSQGGGLGLSKILEKQLTPKSAVTPAKAAAVYSAGKMNTHE
jgi:flagellar protein FlgJ